MYIAVNTEGTSIEIGSLCKGFRRASSVFLDHTRNKIKRLDEFRFRTWAHIYPF